MRAFLILTVSLTTSRLQKFVLPGGLQPILGYITWNALRTLTKYICFRAPNRCGKNFSGEIVL